MGRDNADQYGDSVKVRQTMAPGWFQKAKSSFSPREPQVQPFQLDCACGARAVGVRLAQSQRLTCRECGLTLFVLPVCPYPIPKSLTTAFYGGQAPQPQTKSPKSTATKTSGKASVAAPAKSAPAQPVKVKLPRRTWDDYRAIQLAWLRTQLTPLRLIGLALAMTLAATGSFLWNNMLTERARRVLEPALEKGRAAYASHDFATAARELRVAHEALQRLGRSDDVSRKVAQQYRQAQSAASLMSGDFSDSFTETVEDSGTEELESRSKRRLGGQWLLVDATFTVSESSGKGSKVWRSDAPLLIGESLCWIELPELHRAHWPKISSGKPQRLIFAALCDHLSVLNAKTMECRLLLSEQSVVFWTDVEGYAGLVPLPDDTEERKQLELVLQSQRELVLGEAHP